MLFSWSEILIWFKVAESQLIHWSNKHWDVKWNSLFVCPRMNWVLVGWNNTWFPELFCSAQNVSPDSFVSQVCAKSSGDVLWGWSCRKCDHYPSVFYAIIIYVIEFPGGKIKIEHFFCLFFFSPSQALVFVSPFSLTTLFPRRPLDTSSCFQETAVQ